MINSNCSRWPSLIFAGGTFSADAMVDFWTVGRETAPGGEGFDAARNAADTILINDVVADEFDEFAVYEAELNRIFGRGVHTMFVLDEVRRVGSGVMVELLRTHPKLLVGGLSLDNPHYLAPDEYVVSRRARCLGCAERERAPCGGVGR